MKIVVLAGGLSTERDVSINSATQVCKALREKGHQAVILDIFLGHGKSGDDLTGIFDGDPQLTKLSDQIQSVDPDLDQCHERGRSELSVWTKRDRDLSYGGHCVYGTSWCRGRERKGAGGI